jgi:hypothetical protein
VNGPSPQICPHDGRILSGTLNKKLGIHKKHHYSEVYDGYVVGEN